MASETSNVTMNGMHHASNGTSNHSQSSSGAAEVPKEEVAWYFVEQYYTTLSRTPDKLYLFFNKRSQYVSGVEDEKVSVCIGQKAINERIKELGFSDTKVRVTNVDSQASDSNIVIQVIGEMSNKSQPHKKFVQTFVLAAQTNGYFVLNDVFRYIKDDDEEELADTTPAAETATEGAVEPTNTAKESEAKETPSSKATVTNDEAVAKVDQELEQVIKQDDDSTKASRPAGEVNGTANHKEDQVAEAEEAPVAAVASTEAAIEEVKETPAAEAEIEAEKPKDPAPTPTPAAKPKPAATPSAPPKPAVPKTWAQLASANRAAAAAAAAPAAAAAAAASSASQTKASPPASTQSQAAAAPSNAAPATTAAAASTAAPAREPSPDSQKSGSQGGWQTAGADHARKGSRVVPPTAADNGRVRAYVKNVTAGITNEELKAHLEKFGELVYFDVNRPKNAAFAEFATKASFDAAVAANPHKLKNESLYVEERRMQPGQFTRGGGGGLRGRGGFEGRPQAGRGGFKPDGQGGPSRGGYGPRGRGNAAARGRGGAPQAA